MSDINLDWDGNDPEQLADDLEALDAALKRNIEEAMETWALMVESSAKELAPVDEGRLRSSINSQARRVSEAMFEAHIGTNLSYAPYVEEGRGSITASGDGVLHFFVDGEEVFAKSVGPAPAQPFLAPAVEMHISDARDLLEEAVNDAAAEVRST